MSKYLEMTRNVSVSIFADLDNPKLCDWRCGYNAENGVCDLFLDDRKLDEGYHFMRLKKCLKVFRPL